MDSRFSDRAIKQKRRGFGPYVSLPPWTPRRVKSRTIFPILLAHDKTLSRGLDSGRGTEVHRRLQRDQVSLSSTSCQVVAQGSGHMTQIDQPETVVKAIRTLVDMSRDSDVPLMCAE